MSLNSVHLTPMQSKQWIVLAGNNTNNPKPFKSKREKPYWLFLFASTFLIAAPVLFILSHLLCLSDSWAHLFDTVLSDYTFNSIALMLGVGIGTLMLGVDCMAYCNV